MPSVIPGMMPAQESLAIADRHRLSVLVPQLLAIYNEGLSELRGQHAR